MAFARTTFYFMMCYLFHDKTQDTIGAERKKEKENNARRK
jgi:hypothetical protein